MKTSETILDRVMVDVRREVAEASQRRPLAEVKRRLADAPPVRSLKDALRPGFGLVAEIKERSPSQGAMRRENVDRAAAAYEASPVVRAVSVLTNATHFGMSIERLAGVRAGSSKPVLRKDFIFCEYQVYEARAFGADAILLMANLLEGHEMRSLYGLARDLGLEVLFECHDLEQVAAVPPEAEIYGINSRTFSTSGAAYASAREARAAGGQKDLTTDLGRFELGRHLPAHAVKVAESGVGVGDVAAV
ncbi:MAG TPA: indole-3-glycerol phosphate synthase TrpC, partial [Methylomirabilota bacterium]|nr:indole-3-glycerol phosphate synthase TrpC [Methylomirabilota bacterium]